MYATKNDKIAVGILFILAAIALFLVTGAASIFAADGDSNFTNIVLGWGSEADYHLKFDGNAQDYYLALDDSADDLLIGLGATVGTTPALAIDEDLKTTTGGDFEINGATPLLVIGDAGTEDTAITYDGNAKDFYVGLDDSADDLILGLGATVGTTGIIYLDENQDVGLGGASTGAKLDISGNVLLDGAADEIQLRVQGYTTSTKELLLLESSGGTDVLAVKEAPAAGSGGDLVDVTDTFNIADGSDAMVGIDVNLTGANHTGSGNTLVGLDLDLTTADDHCTETALDISDTDWDLGIQSALNVENLLLPSIASTSVITSTDGAVWTVGASEVWYIHRVFCNVTTNFDCDGNDCTFDIGDGTDADGWLDLDDAELQTADAEISGLPAGWQGFGSTDTRGAYLAAGAGALEANDTIDITIADPGGTDPTAGAATCYIFYTRLQ